MARMPKSMEHRSTGIIALAETNNADDGRTEENFVEIRKFHSVGKFNTCKVCYVVTHVTENLRVFLS